MIMFTNNILCICKLTIGLFTNLFLGIPYLTITGEEKMRQDYEKRAAYLASEENSAPIAVPENLKSFMEEAEEKIKRLSVSDVSEIILDNLSTYQRKLGKEFIPIMLNNFF